MVCDGPGYEGGGGTRGIPPEVYVELVSAILSYLPATEVQNMLNFILLAEALLSP